MRPPDLPGGNAGIMAPGRAHSFNEAAGFTRRKRRTCEYDANSASMRPPDLPGGNATTLGEQVTPLMPLQ